MRAQLAACLIVAAGLAGCASPTPPPPPMAMAEPSPAPPPAMSMPADGIYRGTVASTDGSPRRCRRMPTNASTRVHNNTFAMHGMRGRIGPDGNVLATPHRGTSMTGMFSNGTLEVTTMNRGCGYHYTLNHA